MKEKIQNFLDRNKRLLSELPQKIELGYVEVVFSSSPDSLLDAQVGFGVSEEGEILEGWNEGWIVIGRDVQVGDPIFVDIKNSNCPVYRVRHGQGIWSPKLIADSLESLVKSIRLLSDIAKGRGSPRDLELNPISEEEKNFFLKKIFSFNKINDYSFWEELVEDSG